MTTKKSKIGTWLSVCDIGGLGETSITATKFYMYTLEMNRGFSPLLIPDCEIDDQPNPTTKYQLTGQQILASLYNLYEEIRDFEEDYIYISKKIGKWCCQNAHPYDIQTINNLVPNIKNFFEPLDSLITARAWYEQNSKDIINAAEINLITFSEDLRSLYERTKTYFALMEASKGSFAQIEVISKEVLCLRSVWNDIANKVVETKGVSSSIFGQFAKTIPKLKISVRHDLKKSTFYLAPEFNSVFDIANYALARIMATNAPDLDEGYSKTVIAFCSACGKMFAKTGNRQTFCEDLDCKDVRNARKAAAYRKRKKTT